MSGLSSRRCRPCYSLALDSGDTLDGRADDGFLSPASALLGSRKLIVAAGRKRKCPRCGFRVRILFDGLSFPCDCGRLSIGNDILAGGITKATFGDSSEAADGLGGSRRSLVAPGRSRHLESFSRG